MGLERRGNGVYFYEKERIGNKVVSRYRGAGALAHLCAETAEEARLMRSMERNAERAKVAELAQVWAEFEQHNATCKGQVSELLTAAGLHRQNRGPWRRKRNAIG